ncbi:MAG: S-methyl-5'-thioadenosine phosphorylase [Chloroflexota bacterium]
MHLSTSPILAVIGGSGLYEMAGLQDIETLDLDTPFGKPSSPIVIGTLEGQRVAFLARHGMGHRITPTDIPYRANIYALKSLKVQHVVSVSACGSLREDYAPGSIVIPDQVFDLTHERVRSFFSNGLVAHISVADPYCPALTQQLYRAVKATGAITHRGGAFLTIEGPRFSTKAESNVYRQWGLALIGMTASPEVFLAREAELCYATMAHVTDYDVWHVSEEPVTVERVIQTLHQNTSYAQQAVRQLVRELAEPQTAAPACECEHALANAILTNPSAVSPDMRRSLDLLVGKYLG